MQVLAEILRNIYIQTSDANKLKIDSLEQHYSSVIKESINNDTIAARSIAYGKQIAQRIFEWSETDGGHRGYLNNFDKKLVFQQSRDAGSHRCMRNRSVTFPAPALGDIRTAHSLLQIPCYSHRRLLLLTQRPALLIIHSLHRCTKKKSINTG